MTTLRFTPFALLLISAFFLQSCGLFNSGDGPPTNTETEFVGVYAQGFEDSWFYTCDYDEEGWKPDFTEESFSQLRAFRESNSQNSSALTKLTIRGVLSKKGSYSGFFARYDREIQILEILDAEYVDETEC
jgi:hypothetical protein